MTIREKIVIWLAHKLPRDLVGWCVVRATVYAASGPYENESPGEASGITILKRWEENY